MVVIGLFGRLVDGDLTPSSDTAVRARCTGTCRTAVGSCTRTPPTPRRGPRAASRSRVLTMIGDEFGRDIPVGPFALIGDDSIGRGIVETLGSSRSRAVLMRHHGPFTVSGGFKPSRDYLLELMSRPSKLDHPVAIAVAIDGVRDRPLKFHRRSLRRSDALLDCSGPMRI